MVFATDHYHGPYAERGGSTNLREAAGVLQSLYQMLYAWRQDAIEETS